MSALGRRIGKLERSGKLPPWVIVLPNCKAPEHEFESVEEYYHALAVEKFGRSDFKTSVFRPDESLPATIIDLIEDLEAFLKHISETTDRVGGR